ncbi:MAG: DUF2877 domain-containing protein [Nitrososphaerota archaeon]|nr:DUF2877 domain-containing protein [Nitrososphaerota archaeon]MDG7023610.1 DUF2877 domain-containing protein [Nitrososphaerota archaeon]
MTRVFRRSAYASAGPDFFLLLWGDGRSPMTINIIGEENGAEGLRAGEECELSPAGVRAGEVEVTVEGARAYRSSLRRRGEVVLPRSGDLLKGAATLRSLYDASPHGPSLVSDPVFRSFAMSRLVSAARGSRRLGFEDFLGLVGRGGGFTPAGDDFTTGFMAVFNYIARSRRSGQVLIPKKLAYSRTIPESAAVMVYSSKGHVDEGMERLILDSLGGRGFFDDLMTLASRGHTSGIDMSMGVLLAEAVETGKEDAGRALKGCLGALGVG